VGGTSCIEVEGQAVNNFVDKEGRLRPHGGMGWEYGWDNFRSHVDTWTGKLADGEGWSGMHCSKLGHLWFVTITE
jgi:hypothetical protein